MNPQVVLLLMLVAVPCTSAVTCRGDKIACANQQECIYASYRCDGDTDCSDGSDEQCTRRKCAKYEFTCANGDCLAKRKRCDGESNCGDNSDEEQCPRRTCACLHGNGRFYCEGSSTESCDTSHSSNKEEMDVATTVQLYQGELRASNADFDED